jgi:hypothetical protein
MRLQFLGDQPPHPAFLDDVARTLSLKLTCVRAMLLTKECVRVLLLGENNTDNDDDDAKTVLPLKDLTDETTSPETIEICADAIETILRGSVRYELSADELRRELERLGLPKVLFVYLIARALSMLNLFDFFFNYRNTRTRSRYRTERIKIN